MITNFNLLADQWAEYWREEYEERAAIIEYVEGEPRNKSERIAFVQTRSRMQAADQAVSRAIADHQQRQARDRETFGR